MSDSLTPEAIFIDLSRGKINRFLALDLLISLTEKSNNPDLRRECIATIRKVGIQKENAETIYKTIERCLLSDENQFVRSSAADLISKCLLKYGKDAIIWTIRHDSSPIVLNTLLRLFLSNDQKTSDEIINEIQNWLLDYADNVGVVPEEAKFFLDIECLFAKNIKSYEISNESFTYFKYMAEIPSLKPFINIKNDHIEKLYFTFYNWLYLKKNQDIIESFRKIKDLPSFLSLHKQYDVKFEDLTAIPPSIGNLNHLKVLKLSSNGIKIIPSILYSLINLRELDLSKNEIEHISGSILNLKKLKILNLKNNKLRSIPVELNEYVSLLDEFQY